MSSDEAPTARDDFFTLIHKGLRQVLFDATTRAGTLDWDDRAAVDGFALQWSELHHLLQIHANHEDEHFFSLLDERAPETVSGVHAEHHDLESELDQLDALVRAQVATPSAAGGLEVYRALSAFVARYPRSGNGAPTTSSRRRAPPSWRAWRPRTERSAAASCFPRCRRANASSS
jgi:Hemerythrin HHE cation binding domain